MKKILASIIFLTAAFFCRAQEGWTNYYQDSKVKIQYQYSDCHDAKQGTHRQYVLLQFENLTGENISVNFLKELWYNGKCSGCETPNPENAHSINLAAKQVKAGSCEDRDKALKIFSKMLDMEKSKLTKFELKNIRIN